jgi:hypothetical protein
MMSVAREEISGQRWPRLGRIHDATYVLLCDASKLHRMGYVVHWESKRRAAASGGGAIARQSCFCSRSKGYRGLQKGKSGSKDCPTAICFIINKIRENVATKVAFPRQFCEVKFGNATREKRQVS